MLSKIIIIISIGLMIGCKSARNGNVKNYDFALQEYVIVLDTPEKLNKTKKVLEQSYGELELINGRYYRLRTVSLQKELEPYLMTAKQQDEYIQGK